MKRRLVNLLKAVVGVAIFAVLCWKGITITNRTDVLTLAAIVITALGVTYSASPALFRIVGELKGGTMVLADFLNRHLLEPQKRRLLEEGRQQAEKEHAATLDTARRRMREQGLNPDDFLPPEEDDDEK